MLSSIYSRLLRQSFEVEFMRWGLVLIFLMFGYTKWFDYATDRKEITTYIENILK